jgi:hypothetical protein
MRPTSTTSALVPADRYTPVNRADPTRIVTSANQTAIAV